MCVSLQWGVAVPNFTVYLAISTEEMNNRGGRAHLQSSGMKNSIADLTALCVYLKGSQGPGRMLVLER